MYTFSFIVGNIIPKSVKCIHSATKSTWINRRTEGVERSTAHTADGSKARRLPSIASVALFKPPFKHQLRGVRFELFDDIRLNLSELLSAPGLPGEKLSPRTLEPLSIPELRRLGRSWYPEQGTVDDAALLPTASTASRVGLRVKSGV